MNGIVHCNYSVLKGLFTRIHSMGGHGALICALKNPGMYASVSAFAPICNPVACPWGKKAFTGYLGTDEAAWKVQFIFQQFQTSVNEYCYY